MKHYILYLLFPLLSLSAFADDDIRLKGGFVVAPLEVVGYTASGSSLAPCESDQEETSYIVGSQVIIINVIATTDVEHITNAATKNYYRVQGNLLTVNAAATIYTIEGKVYACLKPNDAISISSIPNVLVLKFADGTAYKIRK
mgnify:FL=1